MTLRIVAHLRQRYGTNPIFIQAFPNPEVKQLILRYELQFLIDQIRPKTPTRPLSPMLSNSSGWLAMITIGR